MARRADGRVNSTDRTKRYTPDTFEDGSAVRRLAAQPQEAPKEARPLKSGVSSQTRRNRARATQISAGYAVFLAIVCTLCIAACVAYVKLQTVVTIDAKGRLIIPSKFREQLGEEFVLTKGLDGCLSIYPNDEWAAFEEKLRALPLTNKNARTFSRFFVAGATSCELDKQGRILVPATLREFAGLEKDVVLTGNINRIEIWSKEKWNENSNYDDMDAIAESMEEMGIVI